jgi:hypothetical protein
MRNQLDGSLAWLAARLPGRISLGIETSIIVPGAFTQGTNHFAHAGHHRNAAAGSMTGDSTEGRRRAPVAEAALRRGHSR